MSICVPDRQYKADTDSDSELGVSQLGGEKPDIGGSLTFSNDRFGTLGRVPVILL